MKGQYNMITKIKKIVSILLIFLILVNVCKYNKVSAVDGEKHMVSNCSKPYDDLLGDFSGKEYLITGWYSRPWYCVLRHPDSKVAEKIAQLAVEAANNDHIGYSNVYPYRETFWQQLEASNYSPAKIQQDCASDCSGSTGMIVRAVGYQLNNEQLKSVDTGGTTTMRQNFSDHGFTVLTDRKYLDGPESLQPGDVLLNDDLHASIYVGDPDNIKVSGEASQGGYAVGNGTKISECAWRT